MRVGFVCLYSSPSAIVLHSHIHCLFWLIAQNMILTWRCSLKRRRMERWGVEWATWEEWSVRVGTERGQWRTFRATGNSTGRYKEREMDIENDWEMKKRLSEKWIREKIRLKNISYKAIDILKKMEVSVSDVKKPTAVWLCFSVQQGKLFYRMSLSPREPRFRLNLPFRDWT